MKEKINRMNNPEVLENKIKDMNVEISLMRSRLSVLQRVEKQKIDLDKKKLKLKDSLDEDGLRDEEEIKYTINPRQKMLMKNLLKNKKSRLKLKSQLNPLDFWLLNVFSYND